MFNKLLSKALLALIVIAFAAGCTSKTAALTTYTIDEPALIGVGITTATPIILPRNNLGSPLSKKRSGEPDHYVVLSSITPTSLVIIPFAADTQVDQY